jgi:predicted GH43/DUF377 family glycosyl hydrolase
MATGLKQNLVIGKDYSSLLRGCSYIEPHIYDGHWSDLKGAIKWSKQNFDEVIVLQTHGNGFPIQHRTPSFQIDQYFRAGRIDDWDKLPLIFDNRDKQREATLVKKVLGRKKQPFILFGDHSESAPFPQKEELFSTLQSEFPKHRIIKLSDVKAEYVFDLLGLYDKADALVTVETAHIHLSKASDVPTVVLAADGWRGSGCSKRFKFYCRYSEWLTRRGKVIGEIRNAVEKVEPIRIHEIKTTFKNGYNLSTCEGFGVYRYHESDWKTKLAIVLKSGETFPLNANETLKDFSIEDCRLFMLKEKLHGAYTVSMAQNNLFRCYMAYGEITEKDGVWSIGHIQPKYAGNDFSGLTKNWTPFIHNDKIHFIYGIKVEDQIVLRVEGDNVQAEHRSPAPKWSNGEIRGGVVVPHGQNLLRFFHSRADYTDKSFRYFIGASLLENFPPFRTIAMCKTSIMSGNEIYTPNVRHYKKNVVFALGCEKQDDKYLLSFGRNDYQCCIAELSEKDLRL